MTKIGINGFGRIGIAFRIAAQNNNVGCCHQRPAGRDPFGLPIEIWFGSWKIPWNDWSKDCHLVVDGKTVRCDGRDRNPEDLKWNEARGKVVIDCTGIFTKRYRRAHLKAGARVVISAPSKGNVCNGVNHTDVKPEDTIVSNASCTTNCLAP